ncbi:MAG: fibrobacter succinogenes major paralogous domain-containing protein [Fibrobacter sp.]|nr:fibrobacter succinogenes major paralogous domain-containing protein [Fibrobacter sp.]
MSLKICIPAIAAFLFVACSGDNNKAGDPDPSAEADFVVDSFDNLSVCIDDREGATAYVKDEDNAYICTNGGWTIDTNADTRKKSSSSKDKAKSGSSSGNQKAAWGYLNQEIDYGEMVDDRDGQIYKTVKIGDQVWMAENLNFETENSWCGVDCSFVGRLYTWAAAIDSVKLATDADNPQDCGYLKTCALPAKVQGVCPPGWHLPDTTEWKTLFTAVGGEYTAGRMLKSQTGWEYYDGTSGNGMDAYGFSACPAGYMYRTGYFYDVGHFAHFWSTFENDGDYAYRMVLYYGDEYAGLGDNYKNYALSVRCLQDDASGQTAQSSSSEISESAGTMTDSRDGQTYKTVTIGTQTWMAENLNYKTDSSFCYENVETNCTKYGRLYTWVAAMDSAGTWTTNGKGCGYNKTCSPIYPVRGVCPEGWHLPTYTEWYTLIMAVGGDAGTKLKSTSGWIDYDKDESGNGTDSFGFSARPAGQYDGDYNDEGRIAHFWSSMECDDSYYAHYMLVSTYRYAELYSSLRYYGSSVRCLKD